MSLIKQEDANRWIYTFIAVIAIIATYVLVRFFYQLGDWFDLEAKITSFRIIAQIAGAGLGLISYVVAIKNEHVMKHLTDVYTEMLKVSWADIPSTNKLTIGWCGDRIYDFRHH